MPIRYLNLLFAAVIAIAGWGVIDVSTNAGQSVLASSEYPKGKSSLNGKTCEEVYDGLFAMPNRTVCNMVNVYNKTVVSFNATQKKISADIQTMGGALLLLGSLYGFAFVVWEAALFIRRNKWFGFTKDGDDDV